MGGSVKGPLAANILESTTIRYAQRYTAGPWNGAVCKPITKYKVARKFRITPTMLRQWIRNADSILDQRIGQPEIQKDDKLYSLNLYQEFVALREAGCKVKVNWFLVTNITRNKYILMKRITKSK